MSNIKIMDCTLRDGGYVNDWRFGGRCMEQTAKKLCQASIDYIECGFLSQTKTTSAEQSVFATIGEANAVFAGCAKNIALMVNCGEYNPREIPEYDGGIRYLKLQNDGAFVAQIVMEYRERHTDGQGNVSFAGEWKSWYTAGYRDILQYAERSVDLAKDSNIPNGSQVRLHVYVAAGYSNPSVQQYIFDKESGAQAVYEISGTTLNNYLKLVSYG